MDGPFFFIQNNLPILYISLTETLRIISWFQMTPIGTYQIIVLNILNDVVGYP